MEVEERKLCWNHVVFTWLIAGLLPKGDTERVRKHGTMHVLSALSRSLQRGEHLSGFSYTSSQQTFLLKRATLRQLLFPGWLSLQGRDDAASRAAIVDLKRHENVFYAGHPFYELTTKFVTTPTFEQWRAGNLHWKDLEMPTELLERLQEGEDGINPAHPIPFFGAVVVGYEKLEDLYIGVTNEPLIISALRASARFDVRGKEQRLDQPPLFPPEERARWLAGDRKEAERRIIERLVTAGVVDHSSCSAFDQVIAEMRAHIAEMRASIKEILDGS